MRLEMLVEMQIELLDGQSSCLFSNEPFENRPVMTIEDFVWTILNLIFSGAGYTTHKFMSLATYRFKSHATHKFMSHATCHVSCQTSAESFGFKDDNIAGPMFKS